jgi:hypothetical protein
MSYLSPPASTWPPQHTLPMRCRWKPFLLSMLLEEHKQVIRLRAHVEALQSRFEDE